MEEEPLPTEFITSTITIYKDHLRHIFPIRRLDLSLVDAYKENFCASSSPQEIYHISDKRLFQLPYVTGLCIMISLGKSLEEVNSQENSGDRIERLKRWMSNTLRAIPRCTPSLPLVRALLLAALCYQYEGELFLALKCLEKAKSLFLGIIMDLGRLGGLEDGLETDELHDLALASWDFTNFVSFDSTVPTPLLDFNLAVVREEFGKKAEDVLIQKWSCIVFKVQVASLHCSHISLEQLIETFRSIETLQFPPKPTKGTTIYPIIYFESAKSLADMCCQAASAYGCLPDDGCRQKILPKLSQFEKIYTEFVIETLEQSQALHNLERRRLVQFELAVLGCLAKLSSVGFCDVLQVEKLASCTLFFLRSIASDYMRLSWRKFFKAHCKQNKKIKKKQMATTNLQLRKDYPKLASMYFSYVRGLGYDEKSNHDHLSRILTQALAENGVVEYDIYDWDAKADTGCPV